MNRQQRFLHDILRIDAALSDPAPRKAADKPGSGMKKAGIGLVVAGKRRPHKPGKFGFVHAVQWLVFRDFVAAPALLRRCAKFVQGRGDANHISVAEQLLLDLAVMADGILTAAAVSPKDWRRITALRCSLHVVCASGAAGRARISGGFP
jgi:hypothetical protein